MLVQLVVQPAVHIILLLYVQYLISTSVRRRNRRDLDRILVEFTIVPITTTVRVSLSMTCGR